MRETALLPQEPSQAWVKRGSDPDRLWGTFRLLQTLSSWHFLSAVDVQLLVCRVQAKGAVWAGEVAQDLAS